MVNIMLCVLYHNKKKIGIKEILKQALKYPTNPWEYLIGKENFVTVTVARMKILNLQKKESAE